MALDKVDSSILGRILLFQSAMHLVHDEAILAEMAVHGLSELPGVSDIQFVLGDRVLAETPVIQVKIGMRAAPDKRGGPALFPLRTARTDYGKLLFEVTAPARFAPRTKPLRGKGSPIHVML